jgi:hypothetical protein
MRVPVRQSNRPCKVPHALGPTANNPVCNGRWPSLSARALATGVGTASRKADLRSHDEPRSHRQIPQISASGARQGSDCLLMRQIEAFWSPPNGSRHDRPRKLRYPPVPSSRSGAVPKSGIRAELPEVTIVTKIMPLDEPIARGSCIGNQVVGPTLSEAKHFLKCEACAGFFRHVRSCAGL